MTILVAEGDLGACPPLPPSKKNCKFKSSEMRSPAFLARESKVNDEYVPLKEIFFLIFTDKRSKALL